MAYKIRRKIIEDLTFLIITSFIVMSLFLGVSFTTGNVHGANVTNQTVIARVNVSNTEPILYEVRITNPVPPIDLTGNNITVVTCNGSFQDINGYEDIKNVTATLYYNGTASGAIDSNVTHYTNLSCGPCDVIPGSNNQNGSCLCNFPVQYYADAGYWFCNMTINDSGGLIDSRNTSLFYINEVLGIEVETYVMDFGNLTTTETSGLVRQNVTNGGNVPINITVRSFGGSNESTGINYTMLCQGGTNITFNNHRYSISNGTAFADMYNISNQTTQIPGLTIPKRTTDGGYGNSSNSTWWRLQIPAGASGICNGTMIFGAIDATEQ